MIIRFQNLRGWEWFLIPHGNWIAVNAGRPKQRKENSKNMNQPRIKQQLRRSFFALAIVGALLTLPKAQAQSIPASGSTTDCEHIISVRTAGLQKLCKKAIRHRQKLVF